VQCPLCLGDTKTAKHLFNTCNVARKVWDMCDKWVGIVVVRHESTPVNFQSFCLLSQRQGVNIAWKGMWVAIVSEIWNHKNKVVFKGGLHYKKKAIYRPIFSYQMKWLLIVTKIVTKLDFGC